MGTAGPVSRRSVHSLASVPGTFQNGLMYGAARANQHGGRARRLPTARGPFTSAGAGTTSGRRRTAVTSTWSRSRSTNSATGWGSSVAFDPDGGGFLGGSRGESQLIQRTRPVPPARQRHGRPTASRRTLPRATTRRSPVSSAHSPTGTTPPPVCSSAASTPARSAAAQCRSSPQVRSQNGSSISHVNDSTAVMNPCVRRTP